MKLTVRLLATLALLLLPAFAFATHFETLDGAADCDGWNASLDVYWRSTIYEADLDYAVRLLDGDGVEVAVHAWSGIITRDSAYQLQTYLFDGLWGMELCGDFTVEGTFHIYSPWPGGLDEDTLVFTAAFTCECEEPGHCYLTPGFWKNHPDDWPLTTLSLGGVLYEQDALLEILDAPVRGDATVILAKHLIAAKLNVAGGNENTVEDTLAAADAYLAMHPVFSRPGNGDGRQEALQMKDTLCSFNEQGCVDEDDGADKAAMVEPTSWDNLKATYR